MYTIFLLLLSLFRYRSHEGGHLDPNGGSVRALAGVRIDDNG